MSSVEHCQRVIAFIDEELGIALESRVEFAGDPELLQIIPEAYTLFLNLNDEVPQRETVDLHMADTDYAQALSEGRDPEQESAFARALVAGGIEPEKARQVAPLLGKYPRSPQEQEHVLEVWRKWCLLQGFELAAVNKAVAQLRHKGYPAYLVALQPCGIESPQTSSLIE